MDEIAGFFRLCHIFFSEKTKIADFSSLCNRFLTMGVTQVRFFGDFRKSLERSGAGLEKGVYLKMQPVSALHAPLYPSVSAAQIQMYSPRISIPISTLTLDFMAESIQHSSGS